MLKLHRLAVFPLEIFITKRTASAKYVSGLPHSINSANSPKETLQIKLHANPGSIFHSDWMRLLSYYFYDCDPNGYANVRRTRHPICSVLNSDNIRPIKVLHLYHGTGYCKRFIPHRFFNLQRIPFPYKLKVATRNPSLNVFFFFFVDYFFFFVFSLVNLQTVQIFLLLTDPLLLRHITLLFVVEQRPTFVQNGASTCQNGREMIEWKMWRTRSILKIFN